MERFHYPQHPIRCNNTGRSKCGKSVFLTFLTLKNDNQYGKMFIFSPSLHHDLYQKKFKCFSTYILFHIIPNILNEEDIHVIFDQIVNKKDSEKSITGLKTYESIEELKYPQEIEDRGIIILEDLYEIRNE